MIFDSEYYSRQPYEYRPIKYTDISSPDVFLFVLQAQSTLLALIEAETIQELKEQVYHELHL